MGKKSGFCCFGLLKWKRKKKVTSQREEVMGKSKANRVRAREEDDDYYYDWMADPDIDNKAAEFINAKRQLYRSTAAATATATADEAADHTADATHLSN
ncbi:unnamed protein product [Cuscuta epithymum]|uniref:Uncharacterized protein n=1 Tax=Cuscuta epithymum TaxID=186058 RepID=A0AAV0BUP4_9ASTE|nr:unnamed protein product [Cuscuta epithymum]